MEEAKSNKQICKEIRKERKQRKHASKAKPFQPFCTFDCKFSCLRVCVCMAVGQLEQKANWRNKFANFSWALTVAANNVLHNRGKTQRFGLKWEHYFFGKQDEHCWLLGIVCSCCCSYSSERSSLGDGLEVIKLEANSMQNWAPLNKRVWRVFVYQTSFQNAIFPAFHLNITHLCMYCILCSFVVKHYIFV